MNFIHSFIRILPTNQLLKLLDESVSVPSPASNPSLRSRVRIPVPHFYCWAFFDAVSSGGSFYHSGCRSFSNPLWQQSIETGTECECVWLRACVCVGVCAYVCVCACMDVRVWGPYMLGSLINNEIVEFVQNIQTLCTHQCNGERALVQTLWWGLFSILKPPISEKSVGSLFDLNLSKSLVIFFSERSGIKNAEK